jgi:hypothetical protein
MWKRNSEKTNNKEEKAKKRTNAKWAKPTTSQDVNVSKKNAQKQSNGPGPVTIGVCGAGLAPIRVEYRSLGVAM